jgi:tetratricopeptide (TPR) repeat protein
MLAELGFEVHRLAWTQAFALVDLLAGDSERAAEKLRAAYDGLGRLGEHGFRSTVAVELGWALYENGQADEAERFALAGEEEGAAQDLINFAWGRALRARIAADRGDFDGAERLAREALEYALQIDLPFAQSDALLSLAHVLRGRGRDDEAQEAAEQALAVCEAKGDHPRAERVRTLLAEPLQETRT